MVVFRTLIVLWLVMGLSWCHVEYPLSHISGAGAPSRTWLRLRGGSDLRAEVASLEDVLRKSVELTHVLDEIKSRHAGSAGGRTSDADKRDSDERRSYLKDRVLPMFATAVNCTKFVLHARSFSCAT